MLKRPFCHYFNTTGKCRFGRRCRFLHESVITQPNSQLDPSCQDEAVNSETACELETRLQVHTSSRYSEEKNERINQDTDSTYLSSVPDSKSLTDPNSNNESLNTKQEDSATSAKSQICKYYAENRFCRYGDRCRFLHVGRRRLEKEGHAYTVKDAGKDGRHEDKVQDEGKDEINPLGDISRLNISRDELKSANAQVCKYYAEKGFCRFGQRCLYLHPVKDTSKREMEDEGEDEAELNPDKGPTSVNDVEAKRRRQAKRVCLFYKQGYCRYGRRCGFLHSGLNSPTKVEKEKINAKGDKEENVETVKTEKTTIARAPQITHCYKRDEVTMESLSEMRAMEIRQLKKRFTTDKLRCLEETNTNAKFVFTFSPTDPDWPFEVRLFDIGVEFTEDYPLKLFNLTVPEDQDLPETVRRYIEVSLEEWVKMKDQQATDRGTVELLFRPFLRWLDRNLEELVTQALKQFRRELTAKAAGLEFVSAEELRKERSDSSSEEEETEDTASGEAEKRDVFNEPGVIVYRKSEKEKMEEVYEVPQREISSSDEEESDEEMDEVDESEHKRPQINPDTERRGTELSFRNMQIWFCTTVMMEKLQLTIQCERCKHTTEFSTPPNRVNSIICGKCHTVQLVVFRATLAHSYCSIFGYLDLDGCVVFDVNMQECHFSMGCIQCNRDVLVKHCTPGKLLEPFCRGCHNKMQFASESVKMVKLTTDVDQKYFSGKIHQVNSKMLRRSTKDPAIQEGKPLPNNGACKHYKKSYRWLRFPCCGKCYPCDECHDDKENHEMKYANRMICGFCCREQPYAAEKPCLGCSSALTKVRTTHWEGGKGCRDKISMSRNDNQKYANLSKTESRKSKALKDKSKGKKNTKLRHT